MLGLKVKVKQTVKSQDIIEKRIFFCPQCKGKNNQGEVVLCGRCGFVKEPLRYQAINVPSRRFGSAWILRRKGR
jgi:hypothetical protein